MKRLLIFLKYPTPGKVKTRLAMSVGEQVASDIYRACAEETLQQLAGLRHEAQLYVDPPDALEQTRAWLGAEWALAPQRGPDLGARLASAMADTFAQGAVKVVVIGTDSPWLSPADIEEAFTALDRANVVIGPAEDGGYYLIGLSQPLPALFLGIAWGTASVYAQTMEQARRFGLRVRSLGLGYDVDRIEDLQRLGGKRCPS